jgi:predicted site-specific integrase-resolvase
MNALLTKKQLAARLAVTPRTIENYCQRGIIPFVVIPAGKRFDPAAIDRILKERTFQHHPRGYGQ